MMPLPPFGAFALALGLAFFLGLSFEDFYDRVNENRPGGVRTFPMLALAGGLLYRLEPVYLIPFSTGLAVLGAWLAVYYVRRSAEKGQDGLPAVGVMVLVSNLIAFLLGPAAIAEPPWVAIGITVAGVLFLTARDQLHSFALRIELPELVTAGKFLVITGLILPVLPNHAVTDLTPITPRQVWLAVVAVSAVSYASYLLQRYVMPAGASLLTAVLGGLYSSTVTTVVLARRARAAPDSAHEDQTGIILATAIMYLRLLVVVAVFNLSLAGRLALPLVGLSLVGFAMAAGWYFLKAGRAKAAAAPPQPRNPLELTAAGVFAVLFVVIALAVAWVRAHLGTAAFYVLAAVVGVSDIDPFVLNIAEGGDGGVTIPAASAVAAILIAASSNNVLKAGYAAFIAGRKAGLAPVVALVTLAALGVITALVLTVR